MAVKLSEEQKVLRSRYMEIIREYWKSPRMIEYEEKNIGTIVELDNDNLYVIEKPRIETSFCFGYGMYLRSDEDEERAAFSMEEKARTDSSYFIKENIKPLDRWIQNLQSHEWIWTKRTKYIGQKNSHLVSIEAHHPWEVPEGQIRLTETEKQHIIDGYREVKGAFAKRLNTYLKRYGLSKLKTWTYLRD